MVEELLEFSKMQDYRFTLRIEDVDLQTEFEDAVYTYQELFRQDGIHLEYDDDGELYADPIPGDPERLKQVLCNVLDNAAKHGGSGKRIIAFCGGMRTTMSSASGTSGPASPGGAALCEAEILQGLLQGPWQRHRSGGVR